jgi:hypothetical protein
VAPVAQHAHDLGGERLVEELYHRSPVGAVGLGDRALLDMLARARIVLMSVRKGCLVNI